MIYLDNAATSFPKPQRVVQEVQSCLQTYGGNPGRGSHALSLAASEKIYDCRCQASELFGLSNPENLVFALNTTMALNTVIKGLLKKGDHVLISDMEHNAVYRPIYKLAQAGIITYDIFSSFPNARESRDEKICAGIRRLLRPNTRMLICAHASNICSLVLPVARIGALCRHYGVLFVVDAAQSAGHLPIDMEKMRIDALCVPGHKGLLGPQGCGMLLLREGLVADTLLEGGSGYHSLDGNMPEEAPERYEAGTLPTPAIAGLCEGIAELKQIGIERIARHEMMLNNQLRMRLSKMEGVNLYLPQYMGAILLFHVDGISADTVGQELDRRGFCVRAGYHCTALGHATLHTPLGGAVRVSPGIYNTREQIDLFADAVEDIVKRNRQKAFL